MKKHLSILLISLIINGLGISIVLPLAVLFDKGCSTSVKKIYNEISSKGALEEEDSNDEESKNEEDTFEEDSMISEYGSFVIIRTNYLKAHKDYTNLLYNCLYTNQILTPPKLNV